MINLIGTYECKVDAKGRLKLVTPLARQLTSVIQDGFVLKGSVFHDCLELYPMSEWEALTQKLNKLERFNTKHNLFVRKFFSDVKLIEIDSNGRILIPKDLINSAGINKDIVLTAANNIIEIWDKDKYEEAINISAEEYATLAEELMGGLNDAE